MRIVSLHERAQVGVLNVESYVCVYMYQVFH